MTLRISASSLSIRANDLHPVDGEFVYPLLSCLTCMIFAAIAAHELLAVTTPPLLTDSNAWIQPHPNE